MMSAWSRRALSPPADAPRDASQYVTGRMHADGHVFYVSANGVWLTERVPPEYLTVMA